MTWKITEQEVPNIIPNEWPILVGKSEPVLVCYHGDTFGVWSLKEDWGWHNEAGEGCLPPSHWMPLPEPPK